MKNKILLIYFILNLILFINLDAIQLVVAIPTKRQLKDELFKCGRFDSTEKAEKYIKQIENHLEDRWDETWKYYENNKSKLPSCVVEAMDNLKNWTVVTLEWDLFTGTICTTYGDIARSALLGEVPDSLDNKYFDEYGNNPEKYEGFFRIKDIWAESFKVEGFESAIRYCTDAVFFHELLHIALLDAKFMGVIKDKEFLDNGDPNPDKSAYSVEDCELKLFDYPNFSLCQALAGYKMNGYNEYAEPNDRYDTCKCCRKK